ncbi:MAG: hypothetical protein ACI80S_001975 [Pseudohongiellaceae bacterium]|jgi:hypothetical protein
MQYLLVCLMFVSISAHPVFDAFSCVIRQVQVVDRAGMVDIHLHKRDLSLTQEETNKVADAIASFTTAEIKQSVVSSLYKAHAQNEALILEYYLSVVSSTMPISITRAEAVKQLRDWPILEPFVPISRY